MAILEDTKFYWKTNSAESAEECYKYILGVSSPIYLGQARWEKRIHYHHEINMNIISAFLSSVRCQLGVPVFNAGRPQLGLKQRELLTCGVRLIDLYQQRKIHQHRSQALKFCRGLIRHVSHSTVGKHRAGICTCWFTAWIV